MKKNEGWLRQVEGFNIFSIFIHRGKNLLLCIFTKLQTGLIIKFI